MYVFGLPSEQQIPDTLSFLRRLGFEFHLDWDEELQIEAPPAIDCDSILGALRPFHKAIGIMLEREGHRAREQFVGGPLNGRYHTAYTQFPVITVRIARAKWAIYIQREDDRDPRAFFHGYETSKPKARRRGYQIVLQHRAARHKQEGD